MKTREIEFNLDKSEVINSEYLNEKYFHTDCDYLKLKIISKEILECEKDNIKYKVFLIFKKDKSFNYIFEKIFLERNNNGKIFSCDNVKFTNEKNEKGKYIKGIVNTLVNYDEIKGMEGVYNNDFSDKFMKFCKELSEQKENLIKIENKIKINKENINIIFK